MPMGNAYNVIIVGLMGMVGGSYFMSYITLGQFIQLTRIDLRTFYLQLMSEALGSWESVKLWSVVLLGLTHT